MIKIGIGNSKSLTKSSTVRYYFFSVKTYFWILAHPDDEIFGIPIWNQANAKSYFVYFIGQGTVRHTELHRILKLHERKKKKVEGEIIGLDFKDGKVSESLHVDLVQVFLGKILERRPDYLVTLRAERGHQDHDIVNLFTRILSKLSNIPLIEISAYKHSHYPPGFKVMCQHNSNVKEWHNRFSTARILLKSIVIYKSQWKTWIGLAPFITIKYIFRDFKYSLYSASEVGLIETTDLPLYETRQKANPKEEYLHHLRLIRQVRIEYGKELI